MYRSKAGQQLFWSLSAIIYVFAYPRNSWKSHGYIFQQNLDIPVSGVQAHPNF